MSTYAHSATPLDIIFGRAFSLALAYSNPDGSAVNTTGMTIDASVIWPGGVTPLLPAIVNRLDLAGTALLTLPPSSTVGVPAGRLSTIRVTYTDALGNTADWLFDGNGVSLANAEGSDGSHSFVLQVGNTPSIKLVAGGSQGPAGPAGTSLDNAFLARATLNGLIVVKGQLDATPCDAAVAGDADLVLGVSLAAVPAGQEGNARRFGFITDPSFAFTPGKPVFCGAGGILTQLLPARPASAFLLRVAEAITATTILVNFQAPIALA